MNRLYFGFILIFFFISFSLVAKEGEININYNGTVRSRTFFLGRDVLLNRVSPTSPIYSKESEIDQRNSNAYDLYQSELEARKTGKPSVLSPHKENLQYQDAWLSMNINFIFSQYVDALWGFRVGNIIWGGKPQNTSSPNSPYVLGGGSGGEMGLGETAGVNLQTNFLYMNFKTPSQHMNTRVGLQLFSSVRGRVLYAQGTGIKMTKDINRYHINLIGGWMRARERSFLDRDGNGFSDKNFVNVNVYFLSARLNYFHFMKNELYTYYQQDSDPNDPSQETGVLSWHGFYNEFNFKKYSFVVHGILNQGKVRSLNPVRDETGAAIFDKTDRHRIKGGMLDLEFSYFFDNQTSLNFITVATSGRPGAETDGVDASYRGNGFRTLYPGFSISNVAIDWTGGYAIFGTGSLGVPLSGLAEYGTYVTFPLFRLKATLGYYQLHALKSPHIENNRYFNTENYKNTSTYFGQEYNFDLRWMVLGNLYLIFRSGYFVVGDGLKALNDTLYGSSIREAFLSAEVKF